MTANPPTDHNLILIKDIKKGLKCWTIKAKVTSKTSIRQVNKYLQMFSVILTDQSGEIKTSIFREITKYYDKLQNGKEYIFSKCTIKDKYNKYNLTNHPFELIIEKDSLVQEVPPSVETSMEWNDFETEFDCIPKKQATSRSILKTKKAQTNFKPDISNKCYIFKLPEKNAQNSKKYDKSFIKWYNTKCDINNSESDNNWVKISEITKKLTRCTVKVKVKSKSNVREIYDLNDDIFTMIFCDSSGEIRATVFGYDNVLKYYNTFKVNREYFIKNCRIKDKYSKYNFTNHPYELLIEKDSIVREVLTVRRYDKTLAGVCNAVEEFDCIETSIRTERQESINQSISTRKPENNESKTKENCIDTSDFTKCEINNGKTDKEYPKNWVKISDIIKNLTRCTVKIKVKSKSEIQEIKAMNDKLFTMIFCDSSGEIKATVFGHQNIIKNYNVFEVNSEYFVRNCRIKDRFNKYNFTDHNCELVIEKDSSVQYIPPDNEKHSTWCYDEFYISPTQFDNICNIPEEDDDVALYHSINDSSEENLLGLEEVYTTLIDEYGHESDLINNVKNDKIIIITRNSVIVSQEIDENINGNLKIKKLNDYKIQALQNVISNINNISVFPQNSASKDMFPDSTQENEEDLHAILLNRSYVEDDEEDMYSEVIHEDLAVYNHGLPKLFIRNILYADYYECDKLPETIGFTYNNTIFMNAVCFGRLVNIDEKNGSLIINLDDNTGNIDVIVESNFVKYLFQCLKKHCHMMKKDFKIEQIKANALIDFVLLDIHVLISARVKCCDASKYLFLRSFQVLDDNMVNNYRKHLIQSNIQLSNNLYK